MNISKISMERSEVSEFSEEVSESFDNVIIII